MSLKNDVMLSLRRLRKDLGFTGVAVGILALGIGVNTAIFSLVNVILLRPVTGIAADRMVSLFHKDTTKPDTYRAFSYPDYKEIRENNEAFESVMAHNFSLLGLTEGDVTRRVFGDVVSSNYFQTLGVRLMMGRAFNAEEETPGREAPVTVLSYGLWKKLGADATVLGTQVRINSKNFTVIGVAPDGFSGTMALAAPELWIPLSMYDSTLNDFQKRDSSAEGKKLAERNHHDLVLVGQLKEGVNLERAASQVKLTGARLASAYPAENKDFEITLTTLPRMSVSTSPSSEAPIAAANGILLGLASVVLIVACFNLANMLLARGEVLQKEIALRLSLGSSRGRIVRQLLTEGLVLALFGGAFGLALAYALTRMLVSSLIAVSPLTIVFPMTPDVRVLAATFTFCLLATVFSSLGPALKLSNLDVFPKLKEQAGEGGSLSTARGRFWLLAPRNLLVVLQIGLSLALLATGGLFVRGALAAAESDPGFRLESGALFELDPALAGYDGPRSQQLYASVLDRVRSMPGVEAASLASSVPFGSFSSSRRVRKAGEPEFDGTGAARGVNAQHVIIASSYFKSLGLAMLRGREFETAEETGTTGLRAAIISEPLAHQLFGDEDPIGRTIQFAEGGGGGKGVKMSTDVNAEVPSDAVQIVGIAPGLRQDLFDAAPVPYVYVPLGANFQSGLNLHVRIKSAVPQDASALVQSVRRELRALDPNLPVVSAATLQSFRDDSLPLWVVRSGARLFSLFGGAALILAVIGIYGLKSYVVARRTREIGIRMALGSTSRGVIELFLREGASLATAGLILGLLLALGSGRLVSSMLYQVSPFDPLVLALSFAILAAAALIATYVPARRATRIAPVSALRHE
ncbi:MAG: ABC transporter permease [Vicinamibacteria bacterium]